MVVTIFLDIRRGAIYEYRFAAAGMFSAGVAALIQILFYFHRSNSGTGADFPFGIFHDQHDT